jgi:hypothetical protein
MSQNEGTAAIGMDQGTSARWERGEWEPTGAMIDGMTRFLGGAKRTDVRRAG